MITKSIWVLCCQGSKNVEIVPWVGLWNGTKSSLDSTTASSTGWTQPMHDIKKKFATVYAQESTARREWLMEQAVGHYYCQM